MSVEKRILIKFEALDYSLVFNQDLEHLTFCQNWLPNRELLLASFPYSSGMNSSVTHSSSLIQQNGRATFKDTLIWQTCSDKTLRAPRRVYCSFLLVNSCHGWNRVHNFRLCIHSSSRPETRSRRNFLLWVIRPTKGFFGFRVNLHRVQHGYSRWV